jgi:3D (Asp-Asp-Asp) domain-containing protein
LAVSLAAHSDTTPPVGDVYSDFPLESDVIGPRCPLTAWDPGQVEDGLWLLPPQRQVVPYDLFEAGYPFTASRPHDVVVQVTCTAYSSTPDQTDSTPYITASMHRVERGIIALSRDLLRRYTPDAPFDYGDYVELIGVGVFRVEDTMNRRWRRRADIWVHSRAEARRWGSRSMLIGLIDPAADVEVLDRSPVDIKECGLEVELHQPAPPTGGAGDCQPPLG